ncbi:hypothetical protein [Arthrobacter sp. HLT1-20]
MANVRNYDPAHKGEVFDTLRREILAARLKVTLDQELKRETSPTVKRLAGMKLPPIVRKPYQIIEVPNVYVAGAAPVTKRPKPGQSPRLLINEMKFRKAKSATTPLVNEAVKPAIAKHGVPEQASRPTMKY